MQVIEPARNVVREGQVERAVAVGEEPARQQPAQRAARRLRYVEANVSSWKTISKQYRNIHG